MATALEDPILTKVWDDLAKTHPELLTLGINELKQKLKELQLSDSEINNALLARERSLFPDIEKPPTTPQPPEEKKAESHTHKDAHHYFPPGGHTTHQLSEKQAAKQWKKITKKYKLDFTGEHALDKTYTQLRTQEDFERWRQQNLTSKRQLKKVPQASWELKKSYDVREGRKLQQRGQGQVTTQPKTPFEHSPASAATNPKENVPAAPPLNMTIAPSVPPTTKPTQPAIDDSKARLQGEREAQERTKRQLEEEARRAYEEQLSILQKQKEQEVARKEEEALRKSNVSLAEEEKTATEQSDNKLQREFENNKQERIQAIQQAARRANAPPEAVARRIQEEVTILEQDNRNKKQREQSRISEDYTRKRSSAINRIKTEHTQELSLYKNNRVKEDASRIVKDRLGVHYTRETRLSPDLANSSENEVIHVPEEVIRSKTKPISFSQTTQNPSTITTKSTANSPEANTSQPRYTKIETFAPKETNIQELPASDNLVELDPIYYGISDNLVAADDEGANEIEALGDQGGEDEPPIPPETPPGNEAPPEDSRENQQSQRNPSRSMRKNKNSISNRMNPMNKLNPAKQLKSLGKQAMKKIAKQVAKIAVKVTIRLLTNPYVLGAIAAILLIFLIVILIFNIFMGFYCEVKNAPNNWFIVGGILHDLEGWLGLPDCSGSGNGSTGGNPTVTLDKKGDAAVRNGQNITYTLTATYSLGTQSFDIIDSMPNGTIFVSADTNGQYDSSKNTVTWHITPSSSSSSQAVILVIKPDAKTTNTYIVNKAAINNILGGSGGGGGGGSTSQLVLTKTGPPTGSKGGNLAYTIQVQYPGTADDITISDTLPKDTTFISCSDNCDHSTSTITWSMKKILGSGKVNNVNSSLTLTLSASQDNMTIYNYAQGTLVNPGSGTSGGNGGTPNQSTCSGLYTLNGSDGNPNPLGNFGDPNCDFSDNALGSKIHELDPTHEFEWRRIAQCETRYTEDGVGSHAQGPNSYVPGNDPLQKNFDHAGAWGLFQMGRGLNGQYDHGDVIWTEQLQNAVLYNANLKGSFAYWAPDLARGSDSKLIKVCYP